MNKIFLRHGDVTLTEIDALPEGLKKVENNGSFVLALGEVTGHKHVLTADKLEVFQDPEGRNYFKLISEGKLSHEEHKTLTVAPKIFVQNAEREFDHFNRAIRQVID